MKNKKFLVIVATALMACLVVGMGAMTYSRYISKTDLGSQSATAAKWGYVVTANTDNLFGTQYVKNGESTLSVINESNEATGVTIKKQTSVGDIVAPGSTGSMTFTISGTAEVLAKLTVALTDTKDIEYDGYKPLKWTFKKGDTPVNGAENVTLAELQTALTTFNTTNAAMAPGTDVSATYTISWKWDFETDTATNVKDTLIGYKAADVAWANIQNVKCATDVTYATFTTAEKYNAIKTLVSFSLSVMIEQVQA